MSSFTTSSSSTSSRAGGVLSRTAPFTPFSTVGDGSPSCVISSLCVSLSVFRPPHVPFFFFYSYSKSFFSPCVCRPPEQRWKRRSPKHVRISSQSLSLKALTSLGTSLSLPKVSPHNGLHKRWREWTPSRRTRASGGKENSRAPYTVRRDPLHRCEHPILTLTLTHTLTRRRRRHGKAYSRCLQTVLRFKPVTPGCVPRYVQSIPITPWCASHPYTAVRKMEAEIVAMCLRMQASYYRRLGLIFDQTAFV